MLRMPVNQKKSDGQKKPINPKKRAIQTARKRQSRGRIYLAIVAIIIVSIGVGWYVYSSTQAPPDFAIAAPTGVTIHAGNPVTSRVNVTAASHPEITKIVVERIVDFEGNRLR